ncbi:MAG: hypothetical protein KC620_25375, partial [Myxococcales bacterium]|nr:hypothetical protein [Myxococcales bacterium]
SGTVLRGTVAGPVTGEASVTLISAAGTTQPTPVDPSSGAFALTLTPGDYTLRAAAPGHDEVDFALHLDIGEVLALGAIVLVDDTPPSAPTLGVEPDPVDACKVVGDLVQQGSGPSCDVIAVRVRHSEDGVRVEIAVDAAVAAVAGDGEVRRVTLTAGDGAKRVRATAVDPAGNRSAAAEAMVVLDRMPPVDTARLLVAGGAAEVRALDVDVEVIGADDDAEKVGLAAVLLNGAACERAVCPDDIDCAEPLGRAHRLALDPTPGPQCVCGVLCDAAQNQAALDPTPVFLGPHRARPVPVLDAIAPDALAARPDVARTITLQGAGIAPDTVADIGVFTSLPCRSEATDDCADVDLAACASACAVELPDALRLSSGQYPVWLRTPDPVVDGAGRSLQQRHLTLIAPRPLVDALEPMGVAVGDEPLDTVPVTLRGRDLTDNVQFSLAGRPPLAIDLRRDDPEDARAVTAELAFDLSGLAPDLETDRILAVTNPTGDRVELPFGLVPAVVDCSPTGHCGIPLRRSLGQ